MNLASYTLPNNKVIQHLNTYETDFVVGEIFHHKTYLKHGIQISNTDVIFDVGANIGLFSLFVKEMAPEATIFAFEPSQNVFNILSLNTNEYGEKIKCFPWGVSDKDGLKEFTYYPGYSVISGFHTDLNLDSEVIIEGEMGFKQVARDQVEGYIKERFEKAQKIEVPIRSISSIIKETQVQKIDLLKIDAEKSEVEIIKGITDADWGIINQVVIEVHGKSEALEIKGLMEKHDFKVSLDTEILLENAKIFTLFGRKNAL